MGHVSANGAWEGAAHRLHVSGCRRGGQTRGMGQGPAGLRLRGGPRNAQSWRHARAQAQTRCPGTWHGSVGVSRRRQALGVATVASLGTRARAGAVRWSGTWHGARVSRRRVATPARERRTRHAVSRHARVRLHAGAGGRSDTCYGHVYQSGLR